MHEEDASTSEASPFSQEERAILFSGWRKGSTWHMKPDEGERIIATIEAAEQRAERAEGELRSFVEAGNVPYSN